MLLGNFLVVISLMKNFFNLYFFRYRIKRARHSNVYSPQWRFVLIPRWFDFHRDHKKVAFRKRSEAELFLANER